MLVDLAINWEIILASAIIVYSFFTLIFIVGQVIKNASIVELFWGMSFVINITFVVLYFGSSVFNGTTAAAPFIVSYALMLFWSLRLTFVLVRRRSNISEDFRYRYWRQTYRHYLLVMYGYYLVRATFSFLLSLPFLVMASNAASGDVSNYWFMIGTFITVFGLLYETVADEQLYSFTKKNKDIDKVLDTGLWKTSRHPNYFGEMLVWIGFGVSSVSVNWIEGLVVLIPIIMFALTMRYVSAPMIEHHIDHRKEWKDYKEKTPYIIPVIDMKDLD